MGTSLTLIFIAATNTFNLPNNLLSSLCYVESAHNVNAVHNDDGNGDSLGVCQVKFNTAKFMGFKGDEEDLMDPRVNAYYAAKYLAHQINRYNSIEKGIIAYNMGSAKQLTETEYSVKVMNEWRKHK